MSNHLILVSVVPRLLGGKCPFFRLGTAGLEHPGIILHDHFLLLLLLLYFLLVLEHMLGSHLIDIAGLRESKFADAPQKTFVGLDYACTLQLLYYITLIWYFIFWLFIFPFQFLLVPTPGDAFLSASICPCG